MGEMTPTEKQEFYRRFESLEGKMTRILGILENDDTINEDGLVKKVKLIRRDLSELLVREQVYKAKATTWGIIGGAIGTALIWAGKALLTKLFFV